MNVSPRSFPLDPWAESLWEWQRGKLYWPVSYYEYDRMEAKIVAGPHGFSAYACGYVVGPFRATIDDAEDDLELLMGDLLPHVGEASSPVAAIHAWREIGLCAA